uniref:CRIB domain-containing protein n=1 Tax=Sinocyclocheilus grahami TaxID=75366 RepID=A0A672S8U7_SINGR
MTEFWVCFSCCVAEQPQPKRRRRIDRSMIGEPTNFIHMTHVGSGDMGLGAVSNTTPSLQFFTPGFGDPLPFLLADPLQFCQVGW